MDIVRLVEARDKIAVALNLQSKSRVQLTRLKTEVNQISCFARGENYIIHQMPKPVITWLWLSFLYVQWGQNHEIKEHCNAHDPVIELIFVRWSRGFSRSSAWVLRFCRQHNLQPLFEDQSCSIFCWRGQTHVLVQVESIDLPYVSIPGDNWVVRRN